MMNRYMTHTRRPSRSVSIYGEQANPEQAILGREAELLPDKPPGLWGEIADGRGPSGYNDGGIGMWMPSLRPAGSR